MDLHCTVHNYAWGKLGNESEVARLASVCGKSFSVDPNTPYSELWMGTHVNGPSYVVDTDELLSTWLERNLDSLGVEVRVEFGDRLPFLFKVLSVRKALSIQAHPNKEQAEILHVTQPDVYKDPNHKPELAIALTPFQALCGFRSLPEIQLFIKDLPELQTVLGEAMYDLMIMCHSDDKLYMKIAFHQLMECDANVVDDALIHAIERISDESIEVQEKLLLPLLKKLYDQYPGDRGCWCIYFFNYITLKPGEAIFLAANVPHAYLEGDCIECMACSDNVVRAGLTVKPIDVSTLIEILEYKSLSTDKILFEPIQEDEYTKIWSPSVRDFAVAEIKMPAGCIRTYETIMRPSATLLLVTSGNATVCDSLDKNVTKGSVLYLKGSRQLTILKDDDTEDLIIYQAMCNFG